MSFPLETRVTNLPVDAGDARDVDWVPGSGRSPAEGNSNALQSSCLENLMDSRASQDSVYGVAKTWT